MGVVYDSKAWLISRWRVSKRWIAQSTIVLMFIAFIFSAYLTAISDTAHGLLNAEWSIFWSRVGAVSGIILILVKPMLDALRGDGHLQNKAVAGVADMQIMAKHMKTADRVFIYSGDFSYIYTHEPLKIILEELASREQLTFLSYKKKETVLRKSNESRGENNCLISRLNDDGKIVFDAPENPKFSLIYRRGEEVLLFKHRADGVDYVTIFKASNEMARELVNTFNLLVEGIIALSRTPMPPAKG